MAVATSEDTEITLGTGKMLLLFFGLVALCAVFFAMGFSVGRNSVLKTPLADVSPAAPASSSNSRPSAVKTIAPVAAPAADKQDTNPSATADASTAATENPSASTPQPLLLQMPRRRRF